MCRPCSFVTQMVKSMHTIFWGIYLVEMTDPPMCSFANVFLLVLCRWDLCLNWHGDNLCWVSCPCVCQFWWPIFKVSELKQYWGQSASVWMWVDFPPVQTGTWWRSAHWQTTARTHRQSSYGTCARVRRREVSTVRVKQHGLSSSEWRWAGEEVLYPYYNIPICV